MVQSVKERGCGLLEYYQCSQDKERREGRFGLTSPASERTIRASCMRSTYYRYRPQNQGTALAQEQLFCEVSRLTVVSSRLNVAIDLKGTNQIVRAEKCDNLIGLETMIADIYWTDGHHSKITCQNLSRNAILTILSLKQNLNK
jgi:hypothetical protein